LIPYPIDPNNTNPSSLATELIEQINNDVADAHNNLLLAKITQTHHANKSRSPDPLFKIGEMVLLSMANRHHEYKKKGEKRTAKFFPQRDGPYKITDSHPEASTYSLDIPTHAYPTFHVAQLKCHPFNNSSLFLNHELSQLGPIITPQGLKEFLVEDIVNSCRCDCRWLFLVRWVGYGHEHDLWILASKLNNCKALDLWYKNGGDGPETDVSSI
jgi:hypothetical protein